VKLDENRKPFTGSVKTHEDDVWEYGDNYLDGLCVSQYMRCQKHVYRSFWFTREFDYLLRVVVVGPTLSPENLKQLHRYEGDYEGLYRLSVLCRDEPDKNIAINAHLLHPELSILLLKDFLAYMRKHDIKGQKFRDLLTEFAQHRSTEQLDVAKEDSSWLEPIIGQVVNDNADKVANSDPTKIVNFLVGQVMRRVKGQKVDMATLKAKIEASISGQI
jgi:hypothetical protein